MCCYYLSHVSTLWSMKEFQAFSFGLKTKLCTYISFLATNQVMSHVCKLNQVFRGSLSSTFLPCWFTKAGSVAEKTGLVVYHRKMTKSASKMSYRAWWSSQPCDISSHFSCFALGQGMPLQHICIALICLLAAAFRMRYSFLFFKWRTQKYLWKYI